MLKYSMLRLKYSKVLFNWKLINGVQFVLATVLSCKTYTSTQSIQKLTIARPSMKLWIKKKKLQSLSPRSKKVQTRINLTRRIVCLNKKLIKTMNLNQEALKIRGVVVVAEVARSLL